MARASAVFRGLVAVAATAVLAGCGIVHHRDREPPPEAARSAVVSFLRAAQDHRFAAACRFVAPSERADFRQDALGTFTPDAPTLTARRRQVARAHRLASTCPGAVELTASEIGSRLADLRRRAAAARLSWVGPNVSLDDQAWVLTDHRGHWQLVATNAIADVLDTA